ncbi:MAG: hypothetical protein JY451_15420 [Erythrobacter sp.]|nr:MAG: hypothetical protein JY451_15420 [Erythrobacter sp.]
MRKLILPLALLISACSTSSFDKAPPRAADLAAGDVIAVGQLENLGYESATQPGDLLGSGVMTARFHVARVEIGELPNSSVDVTYFGHTYFREDATFRFHLRPRPEGGYLICRSPNSAGFVCD